MALVCTEKLDNHLYDEKFDSSDNIELLPVSIWLIEPEELSGCELSYALPPAPELSPSCGVVDWADRHRNA